jgi:ABC-type glutathione transport system ATPase component
MSTANTPLLKVTNLVKTFGVEGGVLRHGHAVRAVDGVSLSSPVPGRSSSTGTTSLL